MPEFDDVPFTDPGKRRVDPIAVVFVALLVVAVLVVVYVMRSPGAVLDTPKTARDGGGAADAGPLQPLPLADPAALVAKVDQMKPTTKKGQLLKSEMKKRAEAEADAQRKKKLLAMQTAPMTSSGSPNVALSGDNGLKRALQSKLRGVHVVDGASSGFFVSLRNETGTEGGNFYVKCSAAISQLPERKLLSSLSSRADVGGTSQSDQRDAADACAASLAEDVAAWVKSR
jgi:hypothetical protein